MLCLLEWRRSVVVAVKFDVRLDMGVWQELVHSYCLQGIFHQGQNGPGVKLTTDLVVPRSRIGKPVRPTLLYLFWHVA